MNGREAYNAGNLSAREYVNNYNNWVKSFGGRPGHVDINGEPYFYHPTIFITHKQGGKMNAIEQFKQGHKIYIKKKNRGKFTAYCGGNVTSACIAKAKASGNPTLVKRATFAANARKWKHQNGGIIKAETGLSTSSFIDPMIVDYIKAIENPNFNFNNYKDLNYSFKYLQ